MDASRRLGGVIGAELGAQLGQPAMLERFDGQGRERKSLCHLGDRQLGEKAQADDRSLAVGERGECRCEPLLGHAQVDVGRHAVKAVHADPSARLLKCGDRAACGDSR